ncbi:peptide-methionine (S)-S-oxide reductase MsrA [Salinisphaera sp. P385]|uniref:Peptide methionine sulfoxide reductase MsrA n=1 Tax=Spectribacter acetivorans TaxID=3075603 RepID=A0ABU3B806_9GAMM|nr:peptide-methionine (S)-S-oxide reductase MsrA [Salinisphaera sp. P385]MDT0618607.1 peptide-methionine (S)-S-oxide reductase MsrA [Salinisphaera sp. P385]
MTVADKHYVNGHPLTGPFPDHLGTAIFGMGCFWGAERLFWQLEGVYTTAVGYAGGHLEHPSYREVCGGDTGHAEVVLVVYDPAVISYARLLKSFWEGHNPTQGFRQGNDIGDQYRSVIFTTTDEQAKAAQSSMDAYAEQLRLSGVGRITTQIEPAPPFYYAEDKHQQYLAKNRRGYCGLGGTGVTCALDSSESAVIGGV